MAAFLDVLAAFSTWLKIGWVAWIAWGIWQIVWYRQERQGATGALRLPRRLNIIDPKTPESIGLRYRTPEPEPIVHRLVTPDPVVDVPPHVADAASDPVESVSG
jgi:hypothetical protein